jgi:hypothetical protein
MFKTIPINQSDGSAPKCTSGAKNENKAPTLFVTFSAALVVIFNKQIEKHLFSEDI